MAFLKFNKSELVNLSYSLKREIILANRSGSYCNTTIVDCNTRRYHGMLAVPLGGDLSRRVMLLSSLDETLVMQGHQFNLAIHRYGTVLEPRGHKYIVDFNADGAPVITYKVGELVFTKTFLLAPDSDQVLIRYSLDEAPQKVSLVLKPFLSFRDIHALTHKNDQADTRTVEIQGGVSFNLYKGYPDLNLQISAPSVFRSQPIWYEGITYSDEYRRGFDCVEDLLVPGSFTVEMRPGDSIVVSASVNEEDPKQLKRKFNSYVKNIGNVQSHHDILVRNAEILKPIKGGKEQILAGLSWLHAGLLRETLVSLPGLTLYADGDCGEFEKILDDLIEAEQERLFRRTTQVEAPLRLADVLQHYIRFVPSIEKRVWKKYGQTLKGVIESYSPGVRKEVTLHPNGLLWAQMENVALSWMNAYIDGRPVTERAGYQVDTNAWWYNALCFAIEMETRYVGYDSDFVKTWTPVRDAAKANFQKTFWNPEKGYLSDYVDNWGQKPEVRPNQLFAVYVPYSPIDDDIKAQIMQTIANELVTRRGIRTLSPRNHLYRGVYEGSQIDRDLAYHQGCTRTELMGPYLDVCFKMMGPSFVGKAEYLTEGFFYDMSKHGVGAFSELYDGDPPHEPHGAISSACATASLLWCEYLINTNKEARR